MKEEPILKLTGDGSHTLFLSSINETYHSTNGALTESIHVFIKNGLYAKIDQDYLGSISVFEIGLGTGLNLLLTILGCKKKGIELTYTVVEPAPLSNNITDQLNYDTILKDPDAKSWFTWIHNSAWDKSVLKENIQIIKVKSSLQESVVKPGFDLVYFDAFAPEKQPELWTLDIFKNVFIMMNDFSFLVTYCSKSQVRRDLLMAGFLVEKLPGAPGKREMIRASKPPQNS